QLNVHRRTHSSDHLYFQLMIFIQMSISDSELVKSPYKCELCDQRFTTSRALKWHMDQHVPESEWIRFECDICQNSFSR
ncbi:hypothetical protein PRIPAC_89699, partial [Pristionchus pacificus]